MYSEWPLNDAEIQFNYIFTVEHGVALVKFFEMTKNLPITMFDYL